MSEINPFVNKTGFWHQDVCGLFAPSSLKMESFHNRKLFSRLLANGCCVDFLGSKPYLIYSEAIQHKSIDSVP